MELSQNFRQNLPALQNLIKLNGLHSGNGPVSLDNALEFLNINLRYYHKPNWGVFGFAAGLTGYVSKGPVIFLNKGHSSAIQRRTLAHELIHLMGHKYDKAHRCATLEIQDYTLEEAEADWGAAYLLVPLGRILASFFWEQTSEQLAAELDVPVELVELRLKIASELDELGGLESLQ